MQTWPIRVFLLFLAAVAGFVAAWAPARSLFHAALGLGAGVVAAFLVLAFEARLKAADPLRVVGGFTGFVLGLFAAQLGVRALATVAGETLTTYAAVLLPLLLGYLGAALGGRTRLPAAATAVPVADDESAPASVASTGGATVKILDTSVIIGGRITDISETGFLEGTFVIPQFVLRELQHIADSSDSVKRNRGRRGLDILHKLQKSTDLSIKIVEHDFPRIREVDSKLIALAKKLDGRIITNDFNLNKVAELQGVTVLNINQLANAIKPVVLPGELMKIQVLKEGKESNQGVAYLDDGTMVVVDGGRRFIGRQIDVQVSSVLQTPAGRMIFTQPKDDAPRAAGGDRSAG